ncbi:kelch repeat-containing protein [Actinocatenispora sera]|uniref:kelch repeat-containing protein n=1 Tax=Actinocatenispora sera TaxID=390989 RepID=UPI0033C69D2F
MAARSPLRRWIAALAVVLAVPLGITAPSVPAAASVPAGTGAESAPAGGSPLACAQPADAHDGRLTARCFAIVHAADRQRAAVAAAVPPPTALAPTDIRSAYRLPDGGAGQTVAIVDAYGYDNAEADLAAYRAHYGLPECTTANGCFRKVDQRGGTDYPVQDIGWAGETALDLDAVSAACPSCHLLLVQGDDESFDSLGPAVDTAVRLGATVVSNSYGVAGEDPAETDYDHFYDHPGVAVVASSGDFGNVNSWPATSPNVVGIGGTTLTRDTASTRGWAETAWSDAGSGCSPHEPKPAFQQSVATECTGRAAADVSAVADPQTGLAVYDTYGYSGWLQIGGTSLSAPLVAGMYALAGTPEPGTYPVSYPYDAASGLNDVVTGANGACGTVLCNAGPGWDGPTGLGTPAGVSALQHGRFGHVTGTVTDAATRRPIAGAGVATPDGYTTAADDDGRYDLALPAGTHTITVTDYDHGSVTRDVTVSAGRSVDADFRLRALPTTTLSGTVTDGSGHGWPLYTRITIDGYPHGDVFTDPATGRYQVDLPAGAHYRLTVTPEYAGYEPTSVTVSVGSRGVRRDVAVPVDQNRCTAAGYGFAYHGTGATFDGTDTPAGWQVVDAAGSGHVWRFDNPGKRVDSTGGDGSFAVMDSWAYGAGAEDTSLVSPVADLSGQDAPTVSFDSYFDYSSGVRGFVDLSLDGGDSWQTVFEDTDRTKYDHRVVPIPAAAGQDRVRVRFRYTSPERHYSQWQLDNVIVGQRYCADRPANLLVGSVRDRNTGKPVHPATVEIPGAGSTRTIATPADPHRADGLFWLVADAAGQQRVHVAATGYESSTVPVRLGAGAAHVDVRLAAARLSVRPADLTANVPAGHTARRSVTITNTGTATATVTLGTTNGRYQAPTGATGAVPKAMHVRGDFSPLPVDATHEPAGPDRGGDGTAGSWQPLATFPTRIMDNAVAEQDGTIYSLGGVDGIRKTEQSYRYDPATNTWSRIADLPEPREGGSAAFLGGTLYVTGGESLNGGLRSTLRYEPETDSWHAVADAPDGAAFAGRAVLDGKLYRVGGCTNVCGLNNVRRYDPATDRWERLADYPRSIAHLSCGAIGGRLYCAGGTSSGEDFADAYAYAPGTDTWTKVASLPEPLWGSGYTAANGELVVSGGIGDDTITNATYAYDPAADRWSALPPAPTLAYRGGSACGLARVGGSVLKPFNPTTAVDLLPGYWDCAGASAPWLSLDRETVTLAPGQHVTVPVRLSAAGAQRGSRQATVWVRARTPYPVAPVTVTMRVVGHA